MPYCFTVLAKSSRGYSNRYPRVTLEEQIGWRKRAYWAQLNGFEAFPPFAAAVLIAHQLHATQGIIDKLAMVFIFARILHGVFYIFDRQYLRSLAWLIGFSCVLGLFFIP